MDDIIIIIREPAISGPGNEKRGTAMKMRWKRGLAAALVSALLLSMPGGMELASAAADASWKLYAAANTISYTPEGANYTLEFNDGTITGSQFTADFNGTLVLPESIDVVIPYPFRHFLNAVTILLYQHGTFADTYTSYQFDSR